MNETVLVNEPSLVNEPPVVGKTRLGSDTIEPFQTPESMAAYVDSCLTEGSDDVSDVARALGEIARAKKGMTRLARETGMRRESLYKALSETGNPSFATILKVANALGLRLQVTPSSSTAF